jgi:hypothetical protein
MSTKQENKEGIGAFLAAMGFLAFGVGMFGLFVYFILQWM